MAESVQYELPDTRLVDFVTMTRRRPHSIHACLGRPLWGLDYHGEDCGVYSLDARSWQRRAKYTAHLYAPDTHFWERSTTEDLPFTETYFIFECPGVSRLNALVSPGNGFARFTDDARVLQDLLRYLEPSGVGRHTSLRTHGVLLLVLDRLMSATRVAGAGYAVLGGDVSADTSLASRVDAYLLAHADRRVRIDDIARRLGVSRSQLTHAYRAETGTSPMASFLEHRLDLARALILKGERLKVVAARTGFCDEYHLSKAFKRRFGGSPRHYARSLAGGGKLVPGKLVPGK